MIKTEEKLSKKKYLKESFLEVLENYMNTTELPQNIIDRIVDKGFINKNPIYYTYYPYLFNKIFQIKDKVLLDNLSVAGFLYYKAVILIDGIFDNKQSKESFFTYLISDICKEETIKLLTNLFGNKHQFWKSWNARKFQYVKAFEIDQKSHNVNSYEEFEVLADYKSAFGKVAIDALYHLSEEDDIVLYTDVLNSHKLFYAAFQITDDISDLEEDVKNEQFNIAYYELQKEKGKEVIEQKTIKELKNALYLNGTAVKLYDKALSYLSKAKEIVKLYDLPEWKLEIQKLNNEIVKNQLNISGFVNVFFIQNKLSTQKYEVKESPKNTLEKGIEFIKKSQNTEKGNWLDYFNDAGISDVWTTAFLLSQENENLTLNIDNNKAIIFLKQSIKNNSWGYNRQWISDADSTTFVLRALLKNNQEITEEVIEEWYSFQNSDGGFSTYNSAENITVSLGYEPNMNVQGWLRSHFCVSAAAYLFFCEFKINNSKFEHLRSYLIKKLKTGKQESYWWTNDIYALHLLAKGSSIIKDIEIIKLVNEKVETILRGEGFNKIKKEKNYFYLGLLLELLAQEVFNFEKVNVLTEEIVSILINEQLEDGSWLENASMRIPHPSVIETESSNINWKITDKGTNIIVKDFHRIFTTVSCVSGLNSYLK